MVCSRSFWRRLRRWVSPQNKNLCYKRKSRRWSTLRPFSGKEKRKSVNAELKNLKLFLVWLCVLHCWFIAHTLVKELDFNAASSWPLRNSPSALLQSDVAAALIFFPVFPVAQGRGDSCWERARIFLCGGSGVGRGGGGAAQGFLKKHPQTWMWAGWKCFSVLFFLDKITPTPWSGAERSEWSGRYRKCDWIALKEFVFQSVLRNGFFLSFFFLRCLIYIFTPRWCKDQLKNYTGNVFLSSAVRHTSGLMRVLSQPTFLWSDSFQQLCFILSLIIPLKKNSTFPQVWLMRWCFFFFVVFLF